jgi:acyl-CoA synthetase (AMP-forming)/AMP-acid ligase II
VIGDQVTSASLANEYRSNGAWDDTTLAGKVLEWAASRPDTVAVVDREGTGRHTYRQLADDSIRLAEFLTDRGVERGDVVSVQLPNWYETVVVGVGALIAGAVVNPLLPGYREREIRHIVEKARSRMLFTPVKYRSFEYQPMIDALRASWHHEVAHVAVEQADPHLPVLASCVAATASTGQLLRPDPSAISELIFTSGTEATPKGIMHTEETANFSVRAARLHLGITADDVVWMPSPIGHSTGFNYGVRFALYHGLKLVLQDLWDPELACQLIEHDRCSYTLAATTFLSDLIGRADRNDLSSLLYFGCGGAPVPSDLVRAARGKGINVLRLYGSTEVLVGTWNQPGSSTEHKDNTDGVAIAQVAVETRTEDGSTCAPGERGEIYVRGPNTCVGFFEDQERTLATFSPDGWVRSGDLAEIDADGYLTVVGRKKEIIIRGGMNITPREIEELLVEHPHVDAAAVIALPHERLGEIVCACLVSSQPEAIDSASIIGWLRARGLAPYKLPERIEVVEALPYTASGKVKKHELLAAINERSE